MRTRGGRESGGAPSWRVGGRSRARRFLQRGFTMIELIVTLILIGILAISILPRFGDVGIFAARGFQDETKALLRWAQKSAVAQRRTVCVYFTAADAWAHMRSNAADTSCGASAGPAEAPPAGQVRLADTRGQAGASIGAPAGTGYVAAPSNFHFEASGRPSLGQTIDVTGSGGVTVEADTGYVH